MKDGGRKWSDHGELRFLSVGVFQFFLGLVPCGVGLGSSTWFRIGVCWRQ